MEGMRRAYLKCAVRLIQDAFDALAAYTFRSKRQRWLRKKADVYCAAATTTAAFDGWLNEALAAAIKSKQIMQKIDVEGREANCHLLHLVVSAWKLLSIRAGAFELRTYQLVMRWKSRYEAMAWKGWAQALQKRRRRCRMISLMQGNYLAKQAVNFFKTWLDYVNHRVSVAKLLGKAVRSCFLYSLHKAFNSWSELVRSEILCRTRVLRCLQNCKLAKAFRTWHLEKNMQLEKARKLFFVVHKLQKNQVESVMWRWEGTYGFRHFVPMYHI